MENSFTEAAEPEQTVLIIFIEKHLFKSKLNTNNAFICQATIHVF